MIEVFSKVDAPNTDGSSLRGYVNARYDQLVSLLGEPTYNEPSSDNKVQVEWIVKYKGEVFTIYDWKTYNRSYTENVLEKFNIGGCQYGGDFEDWINFELGN